MNYPQIMSPSAPFASKSGRGHVPQLLWERRPWVLYGVITAVMESWISRATTYVTSVQTLNVVCVVTMSASVSSTHTDSSYIGELHRSRSVGAKSLHTIRVHATNAQRFYALSVVDRHSYSQNHMFYFWAIRSHDCQVEINTYLLAYLLYNVMFKVVGPRGPAGNSLG